MKRERITAKDVKKIASLANLSLSESDIVRYASDLEKILGYVSELNELDTANYRAMTQVSHSGNVVPLRPDDAGTSFDQDTALRCAPLAADGHFKVPKVIER